MKITDLNYLKNNGKHIDIIKHKGNTVWKRVKKEFGENPGVILTYTASDNTTIPYELLHGSSNYTTTITGEGPYSYTIATDDIVDLPTPPFPLVIVITRASFTCFMSFALIIFLSCCA